MMRRCHGLAVVILLLAAGCGVRGPQTWRLSTPVLIPPGVTVAAIPQVSLVAPALNWRIPCAPPGDAVTIRKRGKRIQVTVSRDALQKQSPGWLANWTAAAESQGCLAPGSGLELAIRILESVPLDPATAYRLLQSGNAARGYTDLGPYTCLQVVTPIYRDASDADAPITQIGPTTGTDQSLNVAVHMTNPQYGVETSWYRFQPRADHNGATIVPISAERRFDRRTEPADKPLMNYFRFAPDIAVYGLYYKADLSDNGVTEVLVGAPTRAELKRSIERLRTDLSLCTQSDPELCMVIPRRVAVNPFMVVTVNGAEVRLALNGNVRSAVLQGGGPSHPEEVLPQLAVWKPYGGKLKPVEFDRSKPDILRLTLLGGEAISWK